MAHKRRTFVQKSAFTPFNLQFNVQHAERPPLALYGRTDVSWNEFLLSICLKKMIQSKRYAREILAFTYRFIRIFFWSKCVEHWHWLMIGGSDISDFRLCSQIRILVFSFGPWLVSGLWKRDGILSLTIASNSNQQCPYDFQQKCTNNGKCKS